MKFLHRLGYYLGGFSLGLIMLAFFIKGSGTQIPSCSYMPNARALKNMRTKGYTLSEAAKTYMVQNAIDTTQLRRLFEDGEVNFSKSDTRKEPCGIFYIESQEKETKPFAAIVENCEEKVTIKSFESL